MWQKLHSFPTFWKTNVAGKNRFWQLVQKKWPCLPILIWLNLGKSKHRRRFFFQTSFCTQHQSVTSMIGVCHSWEAIKKWICHIGHKLCTRTRMTTSLAPSILANERKLVDINQELETLWTFRALLKRLYSRSLGLYELKKFKYSSKILR